MHRFFLQAGRVEIFRRNDRLHGPGDAQMAGQGAGVDTFHGNDLIFV